MTRIDERKLAKLLAGVPAPEPPPELRDRLIAEIPEKIELNPELREPRVARFPARHSWRLAAAAVLTLAITGAVTWNLRPHSSRTEESLVQDGDWSVSVPPRPEADSVAAADEAAKLRTQPLQDTHAAGPGPTGERWAPGNEAPAIAERSMAEPPSPADRTSEKTAEEAAPAAGAPESGARFGALPLRLDDSSPTTTEQQSRQDRPEPGGAAGESPRGQHDRTGRTDLGASHRPPTLVTPPVGGSLPSREAEVAAARAAQDVAGRSTTRGAEGRPQPIPAPATLAAGSGELQRAPEQTKHERLLVGAGDTSLPNELRTEGFHVVDGADLEVPSLSARTTDTDAGSPGAMSFKGYGVNPFVEASDDRVSTFALEVDTASATVVRRYLEDGHLPPPEAVRVEEMVNAFAAAHDPPPEHGDVRVVLEGGPSPFGENARCRVLRAAVRFRDVDRAARPPAVLTFVVDTSGSMARDNRLGLVQRALASMLVNLETHDRVGLVSYGSHGQILVEPTTDHELVRRALDRLVPSGSTNAEEGLVLGYRLADQFFRPGGVNRVVLCSDGVANVGRTGPDAILQQIRAEARRGIEMTAIGVGMGNYNDVLLEQLADAADGRYAYVDTFDEARRLFVEELTGTLYTVAHDAKAQVELNPEVVRRWRLLGYENRDIADDRFRDPAVDAGEIGAGHTAVAVYEVELADDVPRRATVATLRVRYRSTGSTEEVEVETALAAAALARSWEDAGPRLRLAATVAELAELLRGSYWARHGSFARVVTELDRLAAELDDPRVAEVAGLARLAARLAGDTGQPPAERDLP